MVTTLVTTIRNGVGRGLLKGPLDVFLMHMHPSLAIASGALGFLLSGCMMNHGDMMDDVVVPPLIDIGTSSAAFGPEAAANTSNEPGVVSFELEAREADVEIADGKRLGMWTYNGAVPGPLLEAQVGDRIRVHFTNSLPVSTTIHWHGVRVPADMDGVTVERAPIPPGADFTYEFTATDPGTFWYHPHVASDEQVERGLYGAIVIRDADEPAVTSEHTAVLDDVLLDDRGELAPFSVMQAMLGRQGNVLLVNGHANPQLEVAPGGLHRFHFINAATARYFRLSLGGQAFHIIGFDNGKLEQPRKVTELLLVPGARADVLVEAPADGTLRWRTLSYDRGHGTGVAPSAELFAVDLVGDQAESLDLPTDFPTVEPLGSFDRSRRLLLGEEMMSGHMAHGATGTLGPTFSINGKVFPDGEVFRSTLGAVEEWELRNDTTIDHPFHLHGFRFQVTSENGKRPTYLAYFDTVNVPAKQSTTIRIQFEANPGTWMFHCHILEHAERGMMGMLEVAAPPDHD